MKTLALVVIARNEENHIGRCLQSAAPYVDEIIVVDTGSTDHTKEVARAHGARVETFQWVNDFSAARNFALSCSRCDWNLILDADEHILEADAVFLRSFMEQKALGRIRIISETRSGEELQHTVNHITRLIPAGVRYKGRVHEQVDSDLPRKNVPISVRHTGYLHGPKPERNIPLLLEEIRENPRSAYFHYQLAKEYQGIEDWENCSKHMELAYRFLQGKERYAPNVVTDYLYALMKIRDFKTGLAIIEKNHAWIQQYPDYYFACGQFYLEAAIDDVQHYMNYLPKVEQSYLRCLEIGETDRYDSVTGTGSFAAYYNLGAYYEILGHTQKALHCYRQAAKLGYEKAVKRITEMEKGRKNA